MAFYVLDDNNNKIEALDKEGILNAIEVAIQDGSLANLVADAGFISKLKCCVSGVTNKMGFISQAKYNELVANDLVQPNTLYFIYDDNTAENIDLQLSYLNSTLSNIVTGVAKVPKAITADDALSIGGVPVGFFLVSENGQYTNKVMRAAQADNATNATNADSATKLKTNLITARDNNGNVPITKAGLYSVTITYNTTASTGLKYNGLLSVDDLALGVHTTLEIEPTGLTNDRKFINLLYHTGKYIRAYNPADLSNYNITHCRLITEY